MPPIRLITFDSLLTINKYRNSISSSYASAARKSGLTDTDPNAMAKAFKIAYRAVDSKYPNFGYAQGMSSKDWWKEVVVTSFKEAGYLEKVPADKVQSVHEHLQKMFHGDTAYERYPEARTVLYNLKNKKKMKLGMIANTDERLHRVISALQLDSYFDFILTSKEIGYLKPAKELFEEALRRAEVDASEALHVGDSEQLDFNAARNAGWHALLVCRQGTDKLSPDFDKKYVISDLMPLHPGHPEKKPDWLDM